MAAGYQSLLAYWAGGAGGVTPTTQGGFRTPLPIYPAGAVSAASGPRSLLAFWLGGASAGIPIVVDPGYGGGPMDLEARKRIQRAKIKRIQQDDEEIILIVQAIWRTLH